MRKNKLFIFILLVLALAAGLAIFQKYKTVKSVSLESDTIREALKEDSATQYWTCPMHPQVRKDGPGECPICGMKLVPIYKQDKDKIVVDATQAEKLGIKSQPAEHRHLVKFIRLPGKVSHDTELYMLQQEYLSAFSSFNRVGKIASSDAAEREKSLLGAAELRLKLLGFNEEYIRELEKTNALDESLIYPSKGKVWVHADIYEQDLSLVKPGQKVKALIRGYETEKFQGEIKAIEAVLNTMTRSAKARIEILDPENKLKHELFSDLTLEIDLGHSLSIPRNSLIDTGVRKLVYLDLGNGRYQLQEVKTGVQVQDYVEVLEGLKEGDLVVTDGNFLLDSQTTLSGGQSLLYGAGEELGEKQAEQPTHRH